MLYPPQCFIHLSNCLHYNHNNLQIIIYILCTYSAVRQMLIDRIHDHVSKLIGERTMDLIDNIKTTCDMISQLTVIHPADESFIEAHALLNQTLELEMFKEDTYTETETANIPVISTHGRPKFLIPEEILRFLVSEKFKSPAIASMLGVGLSTIKRRLKEFDLSTAPSFDTMCDEDLAEHIRNITSNHPGNETAGLFYILEYNKLFYSFLLLLLV